MSHDDKQTATTGSLAVKPGKKRAVAQQANITRARARRFAMQAVYQHLLTGDEFAVIAPQVKAREADTDFDMFFFDDILAGISEFKDNFNTQLAPFVSRPLAQLDIVEHAILLVGAYELNNGGTPPKVAINEAIIMAKKFGADDSHKFINSVMDKLYQSLKTDY
ncbi:MAG: transcription antitermination factor NusB [Gammaproteobacteria bacterium]|nr:MAG: transcription antitermination factor NusB [Gammaproteobacteria bacterium]